MPNYQIQTLHKCGSCLQTRIFSWIAKQKGLYFYQKHQRPLGPLQTPYLLTQRSIQLDPDDRIIIILRHPIDRLISQYYSFGFTHTTKADWIEDPVKRSQWSEKIQERQDSIKQQTLDQYVLSNLADRQEEYQLAYQTKQAVLIPYELILFRFTSFCQLIGRLFSLDPKRLYQQFKHECPSNRPDLSKQIVSGQSDSHIRAKIFKEYQSKLAPKTIQQIDPDILTRYDRLLDQYQLGTPPRD